MLRFNRHKRLITTLFPLLLSFIVATPVIASFDENYDSLFITPALDIGNDTRDNLLLLINPSPLRPYSETKLNFDQTIQNCNLLSYNVLYDFLGVALPQQCDTNYAREFSYPTFNENTNQEIEGSIDYKFFNPIEPQVLTRLKTLSDADQNMIQTALGSLAADHYYFSTWKIGSLVSNNLQQVITFFDVINHEKKITDQDKQHLKQARLALYLLDKVKERQLLDNNVDFQALAIDGVVSEFKHYLLASEFFYLNKLDDAESIFDTLTHSTNPWIAETAKYMLIRTNLGRVANYTDEWSLKPSSVNQIFLQKTRMAVDAYRQSYPNGQYLNSALSFERRLFWFQSDYAALAKIYEQKLEALKSTDVKTSDHVSLNFALINLSDEIDAKLLEEHSDSYNQYPILAFIQLLKDLRQEKPARFEGKQNKEIETEVELIAKGLEEQGLTNAAHYLRLLIDWRLYQNAGVLAQFPDFDEIKDKLSDPSIFAMQILRSEILRKINEKEALLDVWKTIIASPNITLSQQQYAQLQLAGAYIANKQIEQIFAPQSPITNLYYRAAVLNQTANDELLREEARNGKNLRERRIALLALFKNHLYQNNFKDMKNDLALLAPIMEADPQKSYPNNYPYELRDNSVQNLTPFQSTGWQQNTDDFGRYTCPSIQTIFDRLAKNDLEDATATLCLGDFLLTYYSYDWLNPIHPKLLASDVNFDRVLNRGKLYDAVLENPQSTKDEKAYALFRKINCYARSGNNSCGDKEVEQSERKHWFNTLKKEYSQSIWAESLKYYW